MTVRKHLASERVSRPAKCSCRRGLARRPGWVTRTSALFCPASTLLRSTRSIHQALSIRRCIDREPSAARGSASQTKEVSARTAKAAIRPSDSSTPHAVEKRGQLEGQAGEKKGAYGGVPRRRGGVRGFRRRKKKREDGGYGRLPRLAPVA